jgi:hypothetical protein
MTEKTFLDKYPEFKNTGLHNVDIVLGRPLVKRTSVWQEEELEKILDKHFIRKEDRFDDCHCPECRPHEFIENQKVKEAIEKHICDLKFKILKEIKLPATERYTHDHIQEFEELVKKELGLEK